MNLNVLQLPSSSSFPPRQQHLHLVFTHTLYSIACFVYYSHDPSMYIHISFPLTFFTSTLLNLQPFFSRGGRLLSSLLVSSFSAQTPYLHNSIPRFLYSILFSSSTFFFLFSLFPSGYQKATNPITGGTPFEGLWLPGCAERKEREKTHFLYIPI